MPKAHASFESKGIQALRLLLSKLFDVTSIPFDIVPIPKNSCSCSQKLSFGVMSAKEVVRTAELHVYERPLYSVSLQADCT